MIKRRYCFKPCYKWNTFNTKRNYGFDRRSNVVLNLVINGIPSILTILNINDKKEILF